MGKTGVRGTFAALVAAVKGVSRQRLYAAVMELDR